MSRLFRLFGALLVAALLVPAPVLAHGDGEALVHVPLDHVLPGRVFPVIGADLGPDSEVSLRLSQGEVVASLGDVTARRDGHFRTTRVMPATFPVGYTQLIASSSDGSEAMTWILVGERAEAPSPSGEKEAWRGPALIAGVVILAVAGAAVAVAAVRSRARRAS